eukprot:TRINITY_DN4583_c0_g1_i2.p2 TRINITY_DN4583_c0_g1~~TRINITY_DN4583_c0_g1_i2.p2  ORF type:complete len:153 (-),score=11.11 TRINITY_DN4583_c0_g1_i2:49-507(-)
MLLVQYKQTGIKYFACDQQIQTARLKQRKVRILKIKFQLNNSGVGNPNQAQPNLVAEQNIKQFNSSNKPSTALGSIILFGRIISQYLGLLLKDAWKIAPWQSQLPRISLLNFNELVGRAVLVVIALFILLVLVSTIDSMFIVLMYKTLRKVA